MVEGQGGIKKEVKIINLCFQTDWSLQAGPSSQSSGCSPSVWLLPARAVYRLWEHASFRGQGGCTPGDALDFFPYPVLSEAAKQILQL